MLGFFAQHSATVRVCDAKCDTPDLDVCLRGAPHDVCGPMHDLVIAGVDCLSITADGSRDWRDPER